MRIATKSSFLFIDDFPLFRAEFVDDTREFLVRFFRRAALRAGVTVAVRLVRNPIPPSVWDESAIFEERDRFAEFCAALLTVSRFPNRDKHDSSFFDFHNKSSVLTSNSLPVFGS